jgi:hypothetical protein
MPFVSCAPSGCTERRTRQPIVKLNELAASAYCRGIQNPKLHPSKRYNPTILLSQRRSPYRTGFRAAKRKSYCSNGALPLVAHRVKSRQRSISVAFGAKRTFSEPRLQRRIYEYASFGWTPQLSEEWTGLPRPPFARLGKSVSANRVTRVQNTAKCVAHKCKFSEPIQSDLGRPD